MSQASIQTVKSAPLSSGYPDTSRTRCLWQIKKATEEPERSGKICWERCSNKRW